MNSDNSLEEYTWDDDEKVVEKVSTLHEATQEEFRILEQNEKSKILEAFDENTKIKVSIEDELNLTDEKELNLNEDIPVVEIEEDYSGTEQIQANNEENVNEELFSTTETTEGVFTLERSMFDKTPKEFIEFNEEGSVKEVPIKSQETNNNLVAESETNIINESAKALAEDLPESFWEGNEDFDLIKTVSELKIDEKKVDKPNNVIEEADKKVDTKEADKTWNTIKPQIQKNTYNDQDKLKEEKQIISNNIQHTNIPRFTIPTEKTFFCYIHNKIVFMKGNVVTVKKLNYNLIDVTGKNNSLRTIVHSLIEMKDSKIDDILRILNVGKINFIKERFEETYDKKQNELLDTYFLDKEIAIEFCLKDKKYLLALLLSKGTKEEKNVRRHIINEYFSDETKVILEPHQVSEDDIKYESWPKLFSLMLRGNNTALMPILLSKINQIEVFFVQLSFNKIYGQGFDLKYFQRNDFEILSFLLNQNINCIKMIEYYVKVLKESNQEKLAEKIKKKFRIESESWISGLKNVLDKGIKKMVGVDENEEEIKDAEQKNTTFKQITVPAPVKIIDEQKNIADNSSNVIVNSVDDKNHVSKTVFNRDDELEIAKEQVNELKTDITNESIPKDDEEKKVEISEDAENKTGFFSRLNIFARGKPKTSDKSTIPPKINLRTEPDSVFDPVTKKWISKKGREVTQTIVKREVVEVPKPVITNAPKKIAMRFDGSIQSRYSKLNIKKDDSVADNVPVNLIPKK